MYEKSTYVGGRSTTVNVYGNSEEPVELGASIFVQVNRNLVSATKEFGLTIKEHSDGSSDGNLDSLGIWDGEQFKFIWNDAGYNWWNVGKMLWKYGFAPLRTSMLMRKVVGNFLMMYDPPFFPFRSLSQTASALGLTDVTSMLGSQYLEANKIGLPFATDIIQASTRVNYAQNLGEIHGLETMVCMATDGAMSIRGGNWQIFAGMLQSSNAHVLLDTEVSEISKDDDGTYQVLSVNQNKSEAMLSQSYDTVIIAAPLQFSKIEFSPLPNGIPEAVPYVNLYVTLFTSPHKLSSRAFGLPPSTHVPETILTTLRQNAVSPAKGPTAPSGFFSISTLRAVTNAHQNPPRQEYLYKIFSPSPINATFLATLLNFHHTGTEELDAISKDDVGWLYEKSWYSYPYLTPRMTFEEPQLDQDLWYTSGIESFISTMETSSLMGMNVARLVVDDWKEAADEPMEEPREENGDI